nr:MAG TPA: hypothetical protein [Caudoviricetes sp.]
MKRKRNKTRLSGALIGPRSFNAERRRLFGYYIF